MVHQAHNRDKELKPYGELISNYHIKKRLIKLLGHRCSNCKLSSWLGNPIPLELDHINGDNRDNSKENLRLLCPNCHSLTPTFRNKKR